MVRVRQRALNSAEGHGTTWTPRGRGRRWFGRGNSAVAGYVVTRTLQAAGASNLAWPASRCRSEGLGSRRVQIDG
jgi:hypothetical protein